MGRNIEQCFSKSSPHPELMTKHFRYVKHTYLKYVKVALKLYLVICLKSWKYFGKKKETVKFSVEKWETSVVLCP